MTRWWLARWRIVLSCLLLGLAAPATAQEKWPARQITIIVPYAAGTSPDVFARMVGEELAARVGQPVLIDNRTGAGGYPGMEAAAAAAPDGYTLFMGSLDTQAIIQHLYANRKLDPATAFAPVSLVARIVNVIAASPQLPEQSLPALIDAAKKGKSFTFASPGIGTNLHILGELIKLREKVNLVHVPYRAFPTSFGDAMSGRVDLVIGGLPPMVPFFKDNRLKALATTAPQRVAAIPDTPTFAELGYGDISITGWFGLLAPAGTGPAVIARLAADIAEISKLERYRARMQAIWAEPVGSTPAQFKALIDEESARMKDVIQKANIAVN